MTNGGPHKAGGGNPPAHSLPQTPTSYQEAHRKFEKVMNQYIIK